MSTKRMSERERRHRSLARAIGTNARDLIELAQPWNQHGDRHVDEVKEYVMRAAHHANLALRARDRDRKEHTR
jgi:hypothetical protein